MTLDSAVIEIVRRIYGFSSLGDHELEELVRSSSEIELDMGQSLIEFDQIANEIYLLLDGSLRHLGTQLGGSKVYTLALHEPPYIAGLASVQAGQAIETLTASCRCRLLRLNKEIISRLRGENKRFNGELSRHLSSSDIWPLVERNSDIYLPADYKERRVWLNKLSKVCSLEDRFPEQLDQLLKESESRKWIVANLNPHYTYGTVLTYEQVDQSVKEPSEPRQLIRLIGLPKTIWHEHEAEISPIDSAWTKSAGKGSKSLTTNIEIEVDKEIEGDASKDRHAIFYAADGEISEAVACFKTVAHFFNMPLRVEVIERVLSDQFKRSGGFISLDACAALAEALTLRTQILSLPINLISRLKAPAIIHLADGELSVVLEVKDGNIIMARPRSGLQEISVEEIKELVIDIENLSILALSKTSRTPQKNLDFSWFVPALKKNKKALIDVLIASLFVQIFQLMNPLIVQQIVDKVIGQNGISTLPVLAVLLFSFSIFENLLTAVRTNLFIDTTNRIDLSLGEEIIDHLFKLPLNYFDKRPVGELSSRLGELERIRSFLTGTALTVVMDSIFSVIYIVVMLFYSWTLTIVALLVTPLLGIITYLASPIIRGQLRDKAQLHARTQNHLVEVLTGIQTVKAQNFELKARWRWRDRYSDYISKSFKNSITATSTNSLTQFLNQCSNLAVLCVGAHLVLKGDLTLGELIAFRIIAGYVTGPILRMAGLYQSFQQTAISLERLADIIDTPQESSDIDKKNIPMATIKGSVSYEDVSFRFNNYGPLQLSQVSLQIPAGEFVAVVGQSGSGKSTLTKLLPRLYEPLSGRILIDEIDISKVELYSLRRQIGIVPQESLLFEGSIQDNIALSFPEATSEDIIHAARVACAHEFIMTLPNGYATSVGERGGSLSGGQRQRIAIARTVLQNPSLLIMDEATSALDYQTERLVSLNLMEQFRGKTVLFITHRLNSVTNADKIILMHKGVVDEIGSHKELMDKRGRYYALFRQQESSGEGYSV